MWNETGRFKRKIKGQNIVKKYIWYKKIFKLAGLTCCRRIMRNRSGPVTIFENAQFFPYTYSAKPRLFLRRVLEGSWNNARILLKESKSEKESLEWVQMNYKLWIPWGKIYALFLYNVYTISFVWNSYWISNSCICKHESRSREDCSSHEFYLINKQLRYRTNGAGETRSATKAELREMRLSR